MRWPWQRCRDHRASSTEAAERRLREAEQRHDRVTAELRQVKRENGFGNMVAQAMGSQR